MGLTALLPGLRDLRGPLAAGYLWLAVLVSAVGVDGLNVARVQMAAITGAMGLSQSAEQAAHLAVMTFAAYLVGALWDGLFPHVWRGCYQLRFWLAGKREQGRLNLDRPWLGRRATEEVKLLMGDRQHDFANDESRERVLRELALVPTRLAATAPALWELWDRLHAEAQFRMTVSGPLVALGIAQWSAVLSPALVAGGIGLFFFGFLREREASVVLVQAVRADRAGTFAALERSTDMASP